MSHWKVYQTFHDQNTRVGMNKKNSQYSQNILHRIQRVASPTFLLQGHSLIAVRSWVAVKHGFHYSAEFSMR